MKDQVEQLQSIGISALAIEVVEEEAGEMYRLDYLWRSWKPAVEGVEGRTTTNISYPSQSMKTTKFIPAQSEKLSIHEFDKPMRI